jgi:tRNA isopentenyl-2-thiomethyl-A-37 hydroxylase MiaE
MQTTNNYVFLTAESAAIVVKVNNVQVAAVYTAAQLAAVFKQHNINVLTDTIMCSSSIDFAQEEGFATDNCAHNIIDAAIQKLYNN